MQNLLQKLNHFSISRFDLCISAARRLTAASGSGGASESEFERATRLGFNFSKVRQSCSIFVSTSAAARFSVSRTNVATLARYKGVNDRRIWPLSIGRFLYAHEKS